MGTKKKYRLAVFIGRFQPPHLGHIHVIKEGLKLADQVLVLIGSAFKPSDVKNPWTWEQRSEMIFDCFPADVHNRISTDWLEDIVYNDPKWVSVVQQKVALHGVSDKQICIIGHHKDESSYYFDMFPQWDLIDVGNHQMYNSTDIRKAFFGVGVYQDSETGMDYLNREFQKVHPNVVDRLLQFVKTDKYSDLVDETLFYKNHDEMWANSPYPSTFVTVDAFVHQAGHILMIQRDNHPGRSLWALPGGYLDINESILDGVIRELKEETNLRVPEPVLRGSIFSERVFDHPKRSLRGRIITHVYGFDLSLPKNGELQEVRGGDDARKAQWVKIVDIERAMCFEDHYDIIQTMLSAIN